MPLLEVRVTYLYVLNLLRFVICIELRMLEYIEVLTNVGAFRTAGHDQCKFCGLVKRQMHARVVTLTYPSPVPCTVNSCWEGFN